MSAASASKANGAAAATDVVSEWLTWPTERQVAKQLRTSNTQLRSIVNRLGLAPVRAADNTNRYSPSLVAEVERVLRVAEEVADDEDSPAPIAAEATVIRDLIQANREQRQHIEKLVSMICGPMERILDSYNRQNDRNEARIEKLEQRADEANAARAAALDEQQARELVMQEESAKLERRRELFGVVKDRLPSILQALEMSVSGGVDGEKLAAAARLVRGLDPSHTTVLLDPKLSFLSAEQRGDLRKILGLGPEPTPSNDNNNPEEKG